METKEIIAQIDETLTDMQQLVASFEQEEINIVPFEGSWTAGQVAQHMILANSGFERMLNGPVKETDRATDENIEKIKADFLNFNTKMKSPDFIVPADKSYDKDSLLSSLQDIKTKIIKDIETLDLTKTCMALELPVYGLLTRLEAIHFVLYHTQRHIQQLKKIHLEIV